MTRERWDRIKAITTIAALLGFGTLQACRHPPPKDEQQIQSDLNASAESKRHKRQRQIEEASIVCRDGTAYLIGDDHDTHAAYGGTGGPFAVPYYRNRMLMSCGDIGGDAAPQEPARR